MKPAMLLLVCRNCDDILKLGELRERACECGKTRGRLSPAGKPVTEGIYARLLEIHWEDYDGAVPGESFPCRIR